MEETTLTLACRAILFDMDGTLVDSTAVVERQWRRFAEKHGLDYAHIMRISHGRRNAETIREIAPHLATPETFAEFDAAELDDTELAPSGVTAIHGAASLLARLLPREWAVVTSASRELARRRLQSVGLPVPEALIGADDVSDGKPHPQGYLAAARRLGVTPAACVVFEDTPPGLEAGRAAGMRALGITTTYPPSKLAPAQCIADFLGAALDRSASGELRLTLVRQR